MARAFTATARKDIYRRGIKVPDAKTKSGFRADKSQPHPDGDESFMVGGRGGAKQISTTRPSRSQLTQSEFYGTMYDLEDTMAERFNVDSPEELEAARDEICSSLRDIGQEQSDKKDNMPEGLQEGDTGQLLEARAEACESIADEFDQIDLDYDEPDDDEIRQEIADELDPDDPDGVTDEAIEARKAEKLAEWLEEKREELEQVGFDYE